MEDCKARSNSRRAFAILKWFSCKERDTKETVHHLEHLWEKGEHVFTTRSCNREWELPGQFPGLFPWGSIFSIIKG